MSNGNEQLRSGNGTGECTIHIPEDDDSCRALLCQQLLKPLDDARSLNAMGTRPDLQIEIRIRNPQHIEETARHRCIIMLARVNDPERNGTTRAQCFHERCELNEVWTRTGNKINGCLHACTAAIIVCRYHSTVRRMPSSHFTMGA